MTEKIHSPGDWLIQRYKVLRYVDEGGMQQVYLALDNALNRNVALKVPKNLSAEKRFARSARVSAKVVHANIAATLDYFESGGRSYLVEEFIEGDTLSRRLESDFEYLDPHLAAHVIHHLAKGLGASHHVGVFHRDLKPSNIMVSGDLGLNSVKLTDFGIAKMAEEEMADAFKDESSITGSLTAMGALPYMAPEMITDYRSAGLPADIWALGAILYQLISGTPPFGRGLGAAPKIANAVLPEKPQLFTTTRFSPLTDELWNIVSMCLQKDPKDRPSADQLIQVCANLCYSDAPRYRGRIYHLKGSFWGFISSDQVEDVFFHRDSFYGVGAPQYGQQVSFAHYPGAPRARAYPVLLLRQLEE